MEPLFKRADGLVETPSGGFAVVPLVKSGIVSSDRGDTAWFEFKANVLSEALRLEWPVGAQLILLPEDIAKMLLNLGYVSLPSESAVAAYAEAYDAYVEANKLNVPQHPAPAPDAPLAAPVAPEAPPEPETTATTPPPSPEAPAAATEQPAAPEAPAPEAPAPEAPAAPVATPDWLKPKSSTKK